MKKVFLFALAFVLLSSSAVFAAQPGTPEYDQMKAYKKAQREKKDAEKKNPQSRQPSFWEKEASRSGFTGTGAMFGNMISSAVPLEKPNSRKEK